MSNFSMSSISGSDAPSTQILFWLMISSNWSLRRPSPRYGSVNLLVRAAPGAHPKQLHGLRLRKLLLIILHFNRRLALLPQVKGLLYSPHHGVPCDEDGRQDAVLARPGPALIDLVANGDHGPSIILTVGVANFDSVTDGPQRLNLQLIRIRILAPTHVGVIGIASVARHGIKRSFLAVREKGAQDQPAHPIRDLPVAHFVPPLLRSGPSRLSAKDFPASAGQGQGKKTAPRKPTGPASESKRSRAASRASAASS